MVAVGMVLITAGVAAAVVGGFVRTGVRNALATALVLTVLLGVEWALAWSGLFRDWSSFPPPLAPVMAVALLLAVLTAGSQLGARLIRNVPLAAIVGFQGFRLPLELTMHQATVEGLMPVQMSYSGWNFDILTGASAIVVAIAHASGRAPRGLVMAWNLIGSLLLLTIMAIAVASTPTFAAFGADHLNTWIADPPYIWLPGFLVPAALFGHLLVWKASVLARTD